jgi:hypothetical protein
MAGAATGSGGGWSWLAFFEAAGVPETHAESYADVFEDNRMTEDMLSALDREILQAVGVAVMGDGERSVPSVSRPVAHTHTRAVSARLCAWLHNLLQHVLHSHLLAVSSTRHTCHCGHMLSFAFIFDIFLGCGMDKKNVAHSVRPCGWVGAASCGPPPDADRALL